MVRIWGGSLLPTGGGAEYPEYSYETTSWGPSGGDAYGGGGGGYGGSTGGYGEGAYPGQAPSRPTEHNEDDSEVSMT